MTNGELDSVLIAWHVEGEAHLRNMVQLVRQMGGYLSPAQMSTLHDAVEHLEGKPKG